MNEPQKYIQEFAKSRDQAFINFVETGDLIECKKHFEKYGQRMPANEKITKAGILKAVQECTNIPDDIKQKAALQCIALGFSPFAFHHLQKKEGEKDGKRKPRTREV